MAAMHRPPRRRPRASAKKQAEATPPGLLWRLAGLVPLGGVERLSWAFAILAGAAWVLWDTHLEAEKERHDGHVSTASSIAKNFSDFVAEERESRTAAREQFLTKEAQREAAQADFSLAIADKFAQVGRSLAKIEGRLGEQIELQERLDQVEEKAAK